MAAAMELSTTECLKSFHFARGGVVVVGMLKEGSRKAFSVLF